MAGADPATLYELGLHPKCLHQGNIAFLLHDLCVFDARYSRLKMQTMLPKWLSGMQVSTEVHLRRQERG